MENIAKLTIIKALKDLREKKYTAVDLLKACLINIKKYNEEYNVLLTIRPEEELLKEARQIDEIGYDRPLSGIPFVVKDMFSTSGLRTTAASQVLDDYIPKYDATVVKKLKSAGAIIIGKANQDAWAHGATGENSQYGPTKNAYDLGKVAGGSSSGSAVSVALGMCLAAVGTDTGGSIRLPASYNNLVGLKPTYGLVSRYGVIAMASSLDSMGHITKDVPDSAYVLSITAGWDPYDATSIRSKEKKYLDFLAKKDLSGVKIGVSSDFQIDNINPKLKDVYKNALEVLKSSGAELSEVSLPNISRTIETYYIIVPSEISSNLARYDGIRFGFKRNNFGDEARRRIMIGTHSLSSGYYDAYYKIAQKVRTLIINDLTQALTKVDAIFAPVAPVLPYKIGEKVNDPITLYLMDIFTSPVNLSGLPSLAVPSGFVNKLPVGIQFIGKLQDEERLFSIGKIYQENYEKL